VESFPRLLLLPGEPAGIGPDVLIAAAQLAWEADLVAVADPELLLARAKRLNLPLSIEVIDANHPLTQHQPHTLKVIPIALQVPCIPQQLNPANAHYVLACLKQAADLCLTKKAFAMITGPVNKGVMNDAGIKFSGHTEFLAAYCQVKKSVMLFVADKLKVALATTHCPLSAVPKKITRELLIETIQILHAELKNKFKLSDPKIFVSGLNPHAGENGHLGREKIEVIAPTMQFLQENQLNVQGPFPADTIFTEKYLQQCDAILAMYHDQALPIVKALSFGEAVNLTLGLPIIRTSVDHGTACELAGSGKAHAESMIAAMQLALSLFMPLG
jgi:4-hydroxythreonine-4-phosphate dehydrogenase